MEKLVEVKREENIGGQLKIISKNLLCKIYKILGRCAREAYLERQVNF